MYQPNPIFFPADKISSLGNLRGVLWQSLVEEVISLPSDHEKVVAFVLFMVRLNKCLQCETDSYRALRGCQQCATQNLRRRKCNDDELIEQFDIALNNIRTYQTANIPKIKETA